MELIKNNFSIILENNNIIMKGKIEESDYYEILSFFDKCKLLIDEYNFDQINIDLHLLNFINSSGIKILATFIMKINKIINIIFNPKIVWQVSGAFPTLKLLKPDNSIKFTPYNEN